jgi:hypothetical protein
MFATAGCSPGQHQPGRWAVRWVSPDGRILHLGVDVSCNTKIGKFHVDEHPDRVLIELDAHGHGGNCKSSLDVLGFDVPLKSPLGVRWVDGACAGGCPITPDRAPLRCTIGGPPFDFGYLPSGWLTAKNASAGTATAYQSPTGDATLELAPGGSIGGAALRTIGEEVNALGNAVLLDTISGGYAATVDLVGAGAACGRWLLVGRGVTHDTFTTIVQELFPR